MVGSGLLTLVRVALGPINDNAATLARSRTGDNPQGPPTPRHTLGVHWRQCGVIMMSRIRGIVEGIGGQVGIWRRRESVMSLTLSFVGQHCVRTIMYST